ncbi:tyrosine-type recombinase/integrase [Nocardia sp. NBC_01388]|uniref:tyrosine-type recombinase/integrase n=1 Tax=Nocardia sp. NBC_01388 TaxID=2903596 RepID=UPI003254ECE8
MDATALSGQDLAVLRESGPAGLRGRDRDEFWLWLAGRSFTERTRQEYYKQVRRYRKWLVDTGSHPNAFEDGPARDVAVSAYLAEFPATHNVTLAALFVFYGYLGLGEVGVDLVDVPQAVPGALTHSEVSRVRAAAAARSARDYALVELGLEVGPSMSELMALNAEDLTLSARASSVRLTSLDGTVRERDLRRPAKRVLEGWLAERRAILDGRGSTRPRDRSERALFISLSTRKRFEDERGLRGVLARIGADADLGRALLNPARLRATKETRLIDSGMDPKEVAAWMGVKHVNRARVRALTCGAGALSAEVAVGPAGQQLSLDLGI